MKEARRRSHTKWDCKYHMVFIPTVSSVAGFIKGKSVISTARNFLGLKHRLTGKSF